MPYICRDCSNKHIFRGVSYGSCSYTSGADFDEQGGIDDEYDTEYDNHENNDTEIDRCGECGGSDIEWVEDEEWEAWNGPTDEEMEEKEEKEDPNKKESESWADYYKRTKKGDS